MQEFVTLFSSLYSPIPAYDESTVDSLLGGITNTERIEEDRQMLNAKKTDGFPSDFYKSNVELLAPRF